MSGSQGSGRPRLGVTALVAALILASAPAPAQVLRGTVVDSTF
jgi:hypothetical protein